MLCAVCVTQPDMTVTLIQPHDCFGVALFLPSLDFHVACQNMDGMSSVNVSTRSYSSIAEKLFRDNYLHYFINNVSIHGTRWVIE